MKIAIQQGRVIDPSQNIDTITDVAIAQGRIVNVGTLPPDFVPEKTLNAKGQWVLPGITDVCCRPQMQHPQGPTLHEEALAAIKRGITSLCIPPDGEPIVDTPGNAIRFLQQSDPHHPHLYPMGALTTSLAGENIADLTSLFEAGCIAFTNAQHPIDSLQMLNHCFEYAASFDLLVVIQPFSHSLAPKGCAHEGVVATRLGLPGIPETAETIAITHYLQLIEQCGIRAHFTCLSSRHSVALIKAAKEIGLKVSADVAMHSLHLCEEQLMDFDPNCHLYPPLRHKKDALALIEGVESGVIDAICSDHRPLEAIKKLAPFGETTPGLSAFDTFLSLGLKLVNDNKLSLNALIGALTSKPATLFGLPTSTLEKGASADMCIISPEDEWTVSNETMFSKGKNTPFLQWVLPGRVTHTLLNGRIVHEG